jgi:hypothetical protein
MLTKKSKRSNSRELRLKCAQCGNSELFVEIVAHQLNLVNGAMDYVHLIESATDKYRCHYCHRIIKPRLVKVAE